MEFKFYN